jgi:hypothetical protein
MKRLATFSILIVILATSCQTSSELGSSSLIQKRRYTKGFNLNLKKPVISNDENAAEVPSETALAKMKNLNHVERLESPTHSLKTEKGNKLKLASEELSQSLLNVDAKKRESEHEISTAPPIGKDEAYPLTMSRPRIS